MGDLAFWGGLFVLCILEKGCIFVAGNQMIGEYEAEILF